MLHILKLWSLIFKTAKPWICVDFYQNPLLHINFSSSSQLFSFRFDHKSETSQPGEFEQHRNMLKLKESRLTQTLKKYSLLPFAVCTHIHPRKSFFFSSFESPRFKHIEIQMRLLSLISFFLLFICKAWECVFFFWTLVY